MALLIRGCLCNYRPPKKLQEGNVFVRVCLFTGGRCTCLVPCPFWECACLVPCPFWECACLVPCPFQGMCMLDPRPLPRKGYLCPGGVGMFREVGVGISEGVSILEGWVYQRGGYSRGVGVSIPEGLSKWGGVGILEGAGIPERGGVGMYAPQKGDQGYPPTPKY